MLQNIALLKVVGSLTIIGGTAGGAYYAHTKGAFNFQKATLENANAKDYLIVKTTKHTSTASGEIYDYSFLSSPKKNFICSSNITSTTSSTKDDKCEIYKLSDAEKSLADEIRNNFGATTKNIAEEGNYFKITLPKLFNEISQWDDETQLISISETNDANKLFGKLMPIYKVKNGEIVKRKTSFLYAKVDDSGTSVTQPSEDIKETSDKNYQCQFETNKFNCTVIELTSDTTNKTIKTPTENTVVTKNKLKAKNTHFRIEMEEKYLNKFTFAAGKTIDVISIIASNDSKHYAKLTPLFKTLDKKISGKDSFWLSVTTDENNTNTSKTGYKKCKIGDSSVAIDCDVYKFSSDQSSTENINFSNAITKTEDIQHIKKDKFFVIKFTNDNADINDLTPTKKIKLTTTNTADQEYTFTVKKRLFIDQVSDATPLTANTVHLLDI